MSNKYLVDYVKRFGEPATISEEHSGLPQLTVYNQFDSDMCTGFAAATAAEILWGKRFSAGWFIGQSETEHQKGNGRYLIKVLDAMCNIGAVPLNEFGVLEELPDVFAAVKDHPTLLNIAGGYKADGYCNLLYASREKRDRCIKDAISRYNNPDTRVAVLATSNSYFGENHCICLVDWNDETDCYIYQNSQGKGFGKNGRGEIPKNKIDAVYAVFANVKRLPFKDVDPAGWSYNDLKIAYDTGIIRGKTETEFAPGDFITREEVGAIVGRILRGRTERDERDILLRYQGEV